MNEYLPTLRKLQAYANKKWGGVESDLVDAFFYFFYDSNAVDNIFYGDNLYTHRIFDSRSDAEKFEQEVNEYLFAMDTQIANDLSEGNLKSLVDVLEDIIVMFNKYQ
mgnify:CR=1 FL=1